MSLAFVPSDRRPADGVRRLQRWSRRQCQLVATGDDPAVTSTIRRVGTCKHCGEQILWDDGDWITLDGLVQCARSSEHELIRRF